MKSNTYNRQNDTVMNEPDSDNLEDEDLHFIGYCYTTTGGNDKTEV